MPWKEKTKAMLREEFIHEYNEHRLTLSELCRKYKISRPTAYKWLKRAENGEKLDCPQIFLLTISRKESCAAVKVRGQKSFLHTPLPRAA